MICENRISKFGFSVGVILLAMLAATPLLQAQAQGNPVAFNSGGGPSPSLAHIDASVFGTSTDTICKKIYLALSPAVATGVVIDARGINTTASLTCASGETPWVPLSGTATTNPATILLPTATIKISTGWILPNETKLIGEGEGHTVIQPTAINMTVLSMGSSTLCPSGCTGIEISDLGVFGNNVANVDGIVNLYGQDRSFVRNVTLNNITEQGLDVATSAKNSGPYVNLDINVVSSNSICADFIGVATQGIRGLRCTGSFSPAAPAGVFLEASNTTLQDIQVKGFVDGVQVGGSSSAVIEDDVLINIVGSGNVTNTVHIAQGTFVTRNITVIGANSNAGANVLKDDTIGGTLTEGSLAIYVIGEEIKSGTTTIGFSHFSTSPSVPSWVQFNSAGGGFLPGGSCLPGSIASNLTGVAGGSRSGNNTLFVCQGGSWVVVI